MSKDTLKLDLVAISKNGRVYVMEKDTYSSKLYQYTLRFNATEKESFNKKWKVFETVPTIVEHLVKGYESTIKYKLKDGFTPTDKTPEFMTKESFKCCDDECENSEIMGLYKSVSRKKPDEWKVVDMTIEIIDSNCEPLLNPKYKYKVKFPGYIDKHMIIRHTLPCYAEGDYVYSQIRKAVKKNIPAHCKITSDYDFHFEVKASIPYQDEPLIKESKTVIEISTKRYTYSGKVLDVHADNYYLLEEKIDQIIKGHLDKMNLKICVCSECQGKGWVEQ